MSMMYEGSPWVVDQTWYVADVKGPVIVGLPTSRKLGIVTIHTVEQQMGLDSPNDLPPIRSAKDLQAAYPDQFDQIGNFSGKATLHLKKDATPSIDAPRKCSIHLRDKLKKELDQMERNGIIRKVTHHTDWCSSLTTALKKDGSLRVCLDPKRLNQNLKRCPHKIPTLEELNPAFSQAKYFSKLDAKAGYWSVHLDEESQELTTFRSPFGRYCFRRLPFGLSVSQDIFQQRMDTILAQAPGCEGIADDIAVFGKTEQEHDDNLWRLMGVAQKEGLVFNSTKCVIKARSINFFGSLYTDKGIQPDPSKLEDVREMPTPQNKDDLQRVLGMMTYLSPYISNYAEKSAILRDLLKKDVPFTWQEDHEECFQRLKSDISEGKCLRYYNPSVPTVLEVDASLKGLGACLLQNERPVAFASKSLSDAQSNYSNIERETLALVFGITRFHSYLFGNRFTVYTDHKPLETICRKPLGSAPPRLQRLLVKIQGYDCDILYKPGSQMTLPDTLSRLPNPRKREDVIVELRVDEVMELDENHDTDLASFTPMKQTQLQRETASDPNLKQLSRIIHDGWPDVIKQVPSSSRIHWSYREELGVANGIIFKGRQVLIPSTLQSDILEQLHTSHMGIERTRRLARDTVYWPGINKDIENLVKTCPACQENQDRQQREPLQPHEVPMTPWTKVATDLFFLEGTEYLLITDYHSKFPVIRKMHSTTSASVATVMKETFSLLGVPSEVISDNGPQFIGKAFKDMCESWNIKHTTSSPRYPRSNGLAERMVRTIKSMIQKCKQTGQDVQKALLHLRATPQSDLPSPAEMMFGRQMKTTLPGRHDRQMSDVHDQLQRRRDRMKSDHDRHAGRVLPLLKVGQKVRTLHPEDNTWLPAEVSRVCPEPRSYEVTTPNGRVLRRNRSHLREMPIQIETATAPPPGTEHLPREDGDNCTTPARTQDFDGSIPRSDSLPMSHDMVARLIPHLVIRIKLHRL
eukprot:XP_011683484.1 PREDICTED: uncharacterized protein K02A2.6-like [Strongylocentrotus purpuratus]